MSRRSRAVLRTLKGAPRGGTDVPDDVEEFHAADELGEEVEVVLVLEALHEVEDEREVDEVEDGLFLLRARCGRRRVERV